MSQRTWVNATAVCVGLASLVLLAWVANRFLPAERADYFEALKDDHLRVSYQQQTRNGFDRDRFPRLRAPLVIQQIGWASPDGPVRKDGQPADWIEVFNRSHHSVSLGGMALADGLSASSRWSFPDISLPAGSTVRVWADGLNRVSSLWETRDPLTHPRDAWSRRMERTSPAGYVYQAAYFGTDDEMKPVLTHRLDVPATGRYDCWLVLRVASGVVCALDVKVNGMPAVPIQARPDSKFQTVPILPEEGGKSGWPLSEGSATIVLELLDGEIAVDRVVLTDRMEKFGEGEQDLHASLKIKSAGETISLHTRHGVLIDSVDVPAREPGQAYRRVPRGSGTFILTEPMPGGIPMAPPPRFSLPSGVVTPGQAVSVTPETPDGVVHYSLDGSWPTESHPEWSSERALHEPAIITARSYHPDRRPSRAVTRLYYPGPTPNLPLVWCAVRPDLSETLLRYRLARGRRSEQRAYLCIIHPDGTATAADALIRPQGRSSRLADVKQAYRLLFRDTVGEGYWPNTVFEESGAPKHGAFVLTGQSVINHPLALEVLRAYKLKGPRGRLALFKLNHDPMGIYLVLEDINDPYYLEHAFGHLDLDVYKVKTENPVKWGSAEMFLDTWNALPRHRAVTDEEWAELIDRQALMRWAALYQVLGITDNHQGLYVRDRRKEQFPWSFVAWDLDGAFNWSLTESDGRSMPIEGHRGVLLRQLFLEERAMDAFQSIAQSIVDDFDIDYWTQRVGHYEEAIAQHIVFEWAGRSFQQVRGHPDTPEELEAAFREAAARVRAHMEREPPLYLDSFSLEPEEWLERW